MGPIGLMNFSVTLSAFMSGILIVDLILLTSNRSFHIFQHPTRHNPFHKTEAQWCILAELSYKGKQ